MSFGMNFMDLSLRICYWLFAHAYPKRKCFPKKKMYFDGKVRYLTWANKISYFAKSVYLPVSFPFLAIATRTA